MAEPIIVCCNQGRRQDQDGDRQCYRPENSLLGIHRAEVRRVHAQKAGDKGKGEKDDSNDSEHQNSPII